MWRGAAMALGAAVLFGLGTPVAKLLLARIDPLFLAAVLYLGCGIGLALFRIARRLLRPGFAGEAKPTRAHWPWLLGAIFFGGVLGPILLLTGLSLTAAATTSLLLNLESVFTALIAWFVFREGVDRRIALGMAAIALGAVVLTWQGSGTALLGFSRGLLGPLAIAGACLAWALDNNLTRRISLLDPTLIAMLKGLVAGTVNLVLAVALVLYLDAGRPIDALANLVTGTPLVGGLSGEILVAGLLGMLSYGISLVLFVLALRDIGAARTGAYYASAPFIGAILAVAVLGEPLTLQLLLAGALMLVGLWLHLTERHVHEHEHMRLTHDHRHHHDIHHRHDHVPEDPPGEPHSHAHAHPRLRHSHRHFPDAHHAHGH
jgi:drug/metabolite transporter (DMT)-like permease